MPRRSRSWRSTTSTPRWRGWALPSARCPSARCSKPPTCPTPIASSPKPRASLGSSVLFGVVANPASGKDVRRLVARASVFDNQEKQAIVERALIGAEAAGATAFAYLDDPNGIVASAVGENGRLCAKPLDTTRTRTALDTITAARALKDLGCSVVITLGGDGTNRAFALGWPDAPLIPLSTGTNNVFPRLAEATLAGAAAGLIASGQLELGEVAAQQKAIQVIVEDERPDLALIDAVLSRERFVGARALLQPEQLDTALLTRAEPAAVGITAIGGLLHPLSRDAEGGLLLRFGPGGERVRAPIAPGLYKTVEVAECRTIQPGECVAAEGSGVLAFDGERDRSLKPGQPIELKVERTGPWVVDIRQTLELAARKGLFTMRPSGKRRQAATKPKRRA
ncbi:MAG: ATP-NAD kinase [Gammaproteobacteria bacterium]|nr:ATP-NAD kinase [Gammaproteobacteria bacterium]